MKNYPKSLSDEWVDYCFRLWNLCEKYDIDTDKATMWDAFRLLYLESVPDNFSAGRKAKGANNVITD